MSLVNDMLRDLDRRRTLENERGPDRVVGASFIAVKDDYQRSSSSQLRPPLRRPPPPPPPVLPPRRFRPR